eukprot:PhM_4_TR6144/c1_g1_i1/m.1648/K03094/SKP1, CBF3D; S-phase kinase-associated protein 1
MSTKFRALAADATLSDAEKKEFAIVQTKDEKKFAVSKPLLLKSKLVQKMLEDSGDSDELVELPVEADAATMERVFEFLEHHEEHPLKTIHKPLRGPFKELVDEWDWNFFQTRLLENGDEKKNMMLQQVICASNFLIMEDLRTFSCAALASIITTKTTEEEIFDLFGAKGKIKPEHYEKLYAQFPYMRPKEGEEK